ncbi:hypothetical protein FOL47_007282 [Perkinsus chesapeaki]|uniref:Uncharacterized protein n=1 Tax=Perkinsus chesapeaki TaxID=330153 RepID=A0A7J6LLI0_PERCH|nr:hypothetical protein FOL47_007282 [Perkinsus chesapeaki]
MRLHWSPLAGTLLYLSHGFRGSSGQASLDTGAPNPDCSTIYQQALAAQQNVRNLELSVKSAEDEMTECSNGESELQDRMGELTDELEGKMARVHSAKSDVKVAESSLASKEAALQKATETLGTKEERLKDLKSFVSNVESKMKGVSSEEARVGGMLQDARAKEKMVKDNVASKTETFRKAGEALAERQQSLAVSIKSYSSHQGALKKLESKLEAAKEQNTKARNEEKEIEKKRSELDGYISEYQTKVEDSKRRLDELDRQLDSAMLKNRSLARVATEMNTRDLKQAQERLHLVKTQLEAAKQEFNAKSGDILRLQKAREVLEAQRVNVTNSSSSEADRMLEQARKEVEHAKSLLMDNAAKSARDEEEDSATAAVTENDGLPDPIESLLQFKRLRHGSRAEDTPDQVELRTFVQNPSKQVAANMSEELIEKLTTEVDLALYKANTTVGMIESRVRSLVGEVSDAQRDRDLIATKLKKAVEQSETASKILSELEKRNDISKKEEKNNTVTYDHLTEEQAIFAEKYERAHEASSDSHTKLQEVSDRYEHSKTLEQQLMKRKTAIEKAVKALKASTEEIRKEKKLDEDALRGVMKNVTNLMSDYDKIEEEEGKLRKQLEPLKSQMNMAAEVVKQLRVNQVDRGNDVRDAASRLNVEIAALSKAERSQKASQESLEKIKNELTKKQEALEGARKRKTSLEARLEKTRSELEELMKKSKTLQCPELDVL